MSEDVNHVCDRILELLAPFNKANVELTGNTDLAGDLDMDSVAAMNLVMEVEDSFDIDIPINLLSEVRSPKDLAELVVQQLNG